MPASQFDGPTRVWPATSDADWQTLAAAYHSSSNGPWQRVLAVAREAGARSVVDEAFYADLDWRSEYSAFWSKRFAPSRPLTRRLHFFSGHVSDETVHRMSGHGTYLGYTVLRPVEWGRVGRTVLAPPAGLLEKPEITLTLIEDTVSVFGQPFTVCGVPFCQQDAEYLRCAHAAAWVCHYTAFRRGLVGRVSTAELASASPAILQVERQLPSGGMTLHQLQAVFSTYGQPALLYPFDGLPDVSGVETTEPQRGIPGGEWDIRMFSILCRYLNSGFPVLIATADHAFVLVGWYRENGRIIFVACDDQVGPYEEIESPFTDARAPWNALMVPLPPKVLLAGEMAEHHTHRFVQSLASGPLEAWKTLASQLPSRDLSLRTGLRLGSEVAAACDAKGHSDAAVRQLRLGAFPRWVWHVEVQNRALRDAGEPCVVAEALWDSTSHDRQPRAVAVTLPALTQTWDPYGTAAAVTDATDLGPWRSEL